MQLIKSSINNWIIFISVVLGILVFSLGEIALNDIGNVFTVRKDSEILKELQTKEELDKKEQFANQVADLKLNIKEDEYKLAGLEDDIESKKKTLDQLLENQKINPNRETELSIREYQKQFLELQKQKDALKAKLLIHNTKLKSLDRERENYEKLLNDKYEARVEQTLNKDRKAKELKVLLTQIVLILIALGIGVLLFLKFRKSRFLFPVLGYDVAILIILIQAIYIHSPFKLHYYAFIGLGIVICIVIIVWMIRNLNKLSKKQTLTIIKKSLVVHKCPRCSTQLSINTGLKKYKGSKLKGFIIIAIAIIALFGNGSGIIMFIDNLGDLAVSEMLTALVLILFPWLVLYLFIQLLAPFQNRQIPDPDQFLNQNCPVCGLLLITECKKCKAKRHQLLPFCNQCGDEIKINDDKK